MSDQETLEHIKIALHEHQYIYIKPIGKGGFSTVYLVMSTKYNEEFVCKVTAGVKSAACEAEIHTLMNLIHPNIISIYEYFFVAEVSLFFIILEYCPGGSLGDLVKTSGAIHPPLLYQYCSQTLSALKYCHSMNIAHRDIKPANLLLDRNNRIKLADFGLSSRYEEGSISMDFSGSRPYMSPEQIRRQKYCPFKGDVWSLGVTFYQLASGHLPWATKKDSDMKLAITMGIVSYQNCKASQEFCHLLKMMMNVSESKRCSIDFLAEKEIFNTLPERRLTKKRMTSSNSCDSCCDLMSMRNLMLAKSSSMLMKSEKNSTDDSNDANDNNNRNKNRNNNNNCNNNQVNNNDIDNNNENNNMNNNNNNDDNNNNNINENVNENNIQNNDNNNIDNSNNINSNNQNQKTSYFNLSTNAANNRGEMVISSSPNVQNGLNGNQSRSFGNSKNYKKIMVGKRRSNQAFVTMSMLSLRNGTFHIPRNTGFGTFIGSDTEH